ncbi:MAG: hypothetical protein H6741_27890 [Alphaproteobacteria bacterium]|nr:hypothetical protein [Alphaproteobacteria bacterium]MCB9796537.1 hypothetical protein [Alphaproteobacteria bacterium]
MSRTRHLFTLCLGLAAAAPPIAYAADLIAWGQPIVQDNGSSSTRSRIDWGETMTVLEELEVSAYVVEVSVEEGDTGDTGDWAPVTDELQEALAAAAAADTGGTVPVQIIASVNSYSDLSGEFASMSTHDDWMDAMGALAGGASYPDSLLGLANHATLGPYLRGVVVHEMHRDFSRPFAVTTDAPDSTDIATLDAAFAPLDFYFYVPGDHRLIQHVLGGWVMGGKTSSVPSGTHLVTSTMNFTVPAAASLLNGHVSFWYQDSTFISPSDMVLSVVLENLTDSTSHTLHSPGTLDGAQPLSEYNGDMTPYLDPGDEYDLVVTLAVDGGRSTTADTPYQLVGLHDLEVVLSYTTDTSPPSAHIYDETYFVGAWPATGGSWVSEPTSSHELVPSADGLWVLAPLGDGVEDHYISGNPSAVGDAMEKIEDSIAASGWSLDLELMLRTVNGNKYSSTEWYSWDPVAFGDVLDDAQGFVDDYVLYHAPLSLARPSDGIFSPYHGTLSYWFRPYFGEHGHRMPGLYHEVVSPSVSDISLSFDAVYLWDKMGSADSNANDVRYQVFIRDSSGVDTLVAETDAGWDEGTPGSCNSPAVEDSSVASGTALNRCMGPLVSSFSAYSGTTGSLVLRAVVDKPFGTESAVFADLLPVCAGSAACSMSAWSFNAGVDYSNGDTAFDDWAVGVYDEIDSYVP